ncbi:thiol-disulfide oxidoreductase DCC family protein [Ruegeria sp. HKCCD6604]|uniref:thiol-disulfide oxidoreductase DCC family protein n=2 Tax=Ruegeria TaxID=97050 RepID=UPI0035301455
MSLLNPRFFGICAKSCNGTDEARKTRSNKMDKTDKAEVALTSDDAAPHHSFATVYYDGSCPLCSVEIEHYASCEGAERLRFVDVSKPNVRIDEDLTRQEAMDRFTVRRPDGELVSGARAFTELWGTLPKWRWLARVASLPGITPLLELAYRCFLPLRPMLSRIASWVGAKSANETGSST